MDIRAGEILGIYGFMGCGQIELARALFGKIMPGSRHARHRRQAARAAQHGGGPPGRHRLRARKPPRDAVRRRAGLQERLDRDPGPHRAALAAARLRSAALARSPGRGARHPAAQRRGPARRAFGRQPAEGGAGQMAELPAQGAGAERADARHGCRGQGRCGAHRAPACATRAWPWWSCRPSPRRCCRSPTAS